MISFILRRLAVAIPVIIAVATVTFFLVKLIPGSAAAAFLGGEATPEQIAALEAELGLDRPVLEQFFGWATAALRGDLGDSYITGRPVVEMIGLVLRPTIELAVAATLFILVVGYILGLVAAVRGGWLDRVIQGFCSLVMAIPDFWLAMVLVAIFAISLGVLPAGGYVEPSDDVGRWALALILPVVALGLGSLGRIAFQARAATQGSLSRDYVRTLQANGISRRSILYKHVLRNSAVPVVTIIGLQFTFLLGGVVIIEIVFAYPGLGSLMLRAVQSNDFPLVLGVVLYFALAVIIVNLIVDVITAALDPRVRLA